MKRLCVVVLVAALAGVAGCSAYSADKKNTVVIDTDAMTQEAFAIYQNYLKGIESCIDWPCYLGVVKVYGTKDFTDRVSGIKDQKKYLALLKHQAKFWLHDVTKIYPKWTQHGLELRHEKNGEQSKSFAAVYFNRVDGALKLDRRNWFSEGE